MKKLISILLSLTLVSCMAFAFVGCGNNQADGQDEEVDAWIYGIESAYEMGLIDEDDLKSIACRQYECYEMDENPYAGMFTQQTEISVKAERDFKKVYCKRNRIDDPSEVEIVHYYGTYEGNVVVEVNNGLFLKKHIGGVVFTNDNYKPILVLHYTEYSADSATVTGRLHDVGEAYEQGWLNEDDLKSIACCYYDYRNAEENPYSGLYTKPEDKLSKEMKSEIKDAYLRQIKGSWSTRLDDAYLYKYFGTYNGNIVVGMDDESCKIGAVPVVEVGGVTNINWSNIYVYRLFVQ